MANVNGASSPLSGYGPSAEMKGQFAKAILTGPGELNLLGMLRGGSSGQRQTGNFDIESVLYRLVYDA